MVTMGGVTPSTVVPRAELSAVKDLIFTVSAALVASAEEAMMSWTEIWMLAAATVMRASDAEEKRARSLVRKLASSKASTVPAAVTAKVTTCACGGGGWDGGDPGALAEA